MIEHEEALPFYDFVESQLATRKHHPTPPEEAAFVDRFRAMMEGSTDIFCILTLRGELQEISPSWQNFTGQEESEYRGRGWLEAFHPADQPQVEETLIQTVISGQSSEHTRQVCRYDGSYRLMRWRLIPVRQSSGAISELVTYGTDITEQELALSRGAWEEAKSAHQQMEDAWRAMPAPYRFALESRGEQIRFWLACGDLERARTWADSLEQEEPLVSPLARERQEVALARVRLAESRPDQVLALLAPLVARAKATERWDQVLEMWLLQAQAYHTRKMSQEALATLARAVHLAEPEGYIRRFVDEGSPVADLLSQFREQEQSRGPTPDLDTFWLPSTRRVGSNPISKGSRILLQPGRCWIL